MSGENSPPHSPAVPSNRRASFASGQKLSDLFARSPPTSNPASNGSSSQPGPIATAAANASAQQRRRTSLAGLGLSGSPTSTSPFSNLRNRNSSVGSSNSPNSSIEESAVEDGDAAPAQSPSSPFARRMSFGARALHDIRAGSSSSNGTVASNSAALAPSPSDKVRLRPIEASGYNWSEQIRNRAERSASLSQRPAPASSSPNNDLHKAASVAAPEQPVKELPKAPKKPDHFQERILKGDFYMD